MGACKTLLVLVLVLVGVNVALELALRKEFRVHVATPGAATRPCVVVTGASSGIGLHAAAELAAQRGYLVFAGVRGSKGSKAVKAAADDRGTALRATGGVLEPITLDVTKNEQVDAAVEFVTKELNGGRCSSLAGVVNNAGIAVMAPLEAHNYVEDKVRQMFDVNVFGLMSVTARFAPLLRANQGRIVNIGSGAGFFAPPLMAHYAGTKFAVEGASDAARVEFAKFGVSVSLVDPGKIETPIAGKIENTADHVEQAVPADVWSLYSNAFNAFRSMAKDMPGGSPEITTAAIDHALTAAYPSPRYLVGMDANMMYYVLARLPSRVLDAINGAMLSQATGSSSAEL